MASKNLVERRAYILKMSKKQAVFTKAFARKMSLKFGCSLHAIGMDWKLALSGGCPTVSRGIKREITLRDKNLCQYCLTTPEVPVIEHVIPGALGGVTSECNLVLACASCNLQKGRSVWVPKNLGKITRSVPKWGCLVRKLSSVSKSELLTFRVSPEYLKGLPTLTKFY